MSLPLNRALAEIDYPEKTGSEESSCLLKPRLTARARGLAMSDGRLGPSKIPVRFPAPASVEAGDYTRHLPRMGWLT